jgi:hypothetical protein
MKDGHHFTDCINMQEEVCTPAGIRHYIDLKAKERGFKGISDVWTMEATITL